MRPPAKDFSRRPRYPLDSSRFRAGKSWYGYRTALSIQRPFEEVNRKRRTLPHGSHRRASQSDNVSSTTRPCSLLTASRAQPPRHALLRPVCSLFLSVPAPADLQTTLPPAEQRCQNWPSIRSVDEALWSECRSRFGSPMFRNSLLARPDPARTKDQVLRRSLRRATDTAANHCRGFCLVLSRQASSASGISAARPSGESSTFVCPMHRSLLCLDRADGA